jgi:hypothetical protein
MKQSTKKSSATKPPAGTSEEAAIVVKQFKQARIQVPILGLTPFVCNRQSEKVWRELLFPAPKENAATRALKLKHDPYQEFQDSPYLDQSEHSPTLILTKGAAFKSAVCDSAIDSPDVKAAQVRRLVCVPDFYVSLYGLPKMWMTDVRQAGMSRTPDIRTRAILPEWCALVTFTFVTPQVNERKLLHLITNGGMTRGVGDGRTEKGALDFGQFRPVNANDPIFQSIMTTGGREAQKAAMAAADPYDKETGELFQWFQGELAQRVARGTTTEAPSPHGAALNGEGLVQEESIT